MSRLSAAPSSKAAAVRGTACSTSHRTSWSSAGRLTTTSLLTSAVLLSLLLTPGVFSAKLSSASSSSNLTAVIDDDLMARNISDCQEHHCHLDEKRPRLEEDFGDRGCACDKACAVYGDCCRDMPSSRPQRDDLTCLQLRHYDGIAMVAACPAGYPDEGVARLCAEPPPLTEDPFAGMPVSNPISRLTYRNYYCAMCHGDAADAVFWRSRVECPTLSAAVREVYNITDRFTVEHLQRNADGDWGVMLAEGTREHFHKCSIDPFFTETVEFFVRRCRVAVSSCAANWTDDVVADLCGAYNAYVYDWNNAVYRNAHCALCNFVPEEDRGCVRRPTFRTGFATFNTFNTGSFSILMDVGDRSGSEAVGAVSICEPQQLWDPFFKRCRDVVCDRAGYQLGDGLCVPVHNTAGNSTDLTPSDTTSANGTLPSNFTAAFLACPKYYLSAEDYQLSDDNSSIFIPTYDRNYSSGEFAFRDGELVICAVTSDLAKFDNILSYISIVCLAASVLCLVLHLLAFCAVKELRNLSGKNLASLSVCLLVGYVCFLVAPTQLPGQEGCRTLAVVMFAAFIASFGWMNVMAWDVFITLRRATQELRVSGGRHLGRFLLYCCVVLLLTAAAVVAALLAETLPGLPDRYRPGFGHQLCWFSRRRALMAFFAAPLTAVMGVNLVLFVASARMIRQTTKSAAQMTCGPSRINLRLYSRLAVIMGLSWLVGLVAGWLDFQPLWYCFVVLNTLQGVFIFVSFTLADKIRDRMGRRASVWKFRSSAARSLADSNVHTDSSGISVNKSRL